MKIYTTDKIRNVVLLGHSGSGKTSMVEAIAKVAKITDKMGTVDEGNTKHIEGTGLGLSIVKQFLDLMGGTAVENALKLINGEEVEKSIPVEVKLVTKDNVDE